MQTFGVGLGEVRTALYNDFKAGPLLFVLLHPLEQLFICIR